MDPTRLDENATRLGNNSQHMHVDNVYGNRDDDFHGNTNNKNIQTLEEIRGHCKSPTDDFMLACESGQLELAQDALARGARRAKKQGDDGIRRAIQHGHSALVKFLTRDEDLKWNGFSYLKQAARLGNKELVEFFVQKGVKYTSDALVCAAKHGHLQVVEFLEANGADIFFEYERAFLKSVIGGQLPIVRFLVEKGVSRHDVMLSAAAQYGHLDIVQYLRNFVEYVPLSALWRAAENGHASIVFYLMETKAVEFNPEDKYVHRAVLDASKNGHAEIVQYLLNCGAKANTHKILQPLQMAASKGHLEIVELLLHYGANVHARDEIALKDACAGGFLDIVECLVDKGADLSVAAKDALYNASSNGHVPIVQFLVQHGVSVTDTAISTAAHHGHYEIVVYLMEKCLLEFDVEKAIHYFFLAAAENGHLQIAEYLTDRGANVGFESNKALFSCAKKGYLDMIKFLHQRGVEFCGYNSHAVGCAAFHGHLPVVEYLLANNADIHIGDDEPFCLAVEKGNADIVKILIDAGANVAAQKDRALKFCLHTSVTIGNMLLARYTDSQLKEFFEKNRKYLKYVFPFEDAVTLDGNPLPKVLEAYDAVF